MNIVDFTGTKVSYGDYYTGVCSCCGAKAVSETYFNDNANSDVNFGLKFLVNPSASVKEGVIPMGSYKRKTILVKLGEETLAISELHLG